MKIPLLLLFAGATAGTTLFAIGKFNRFVKARRRLVTEALVLDFLVRRSLHDLVEGGCPNSLAGIGELALRGAVDPVAANGVSLVLESAARLRSAVAQSGCADKVPGELKERISSCRGSVLAYNALFRRSRSAAIARICGFSPVRLPGFTGQE